MVCVNDECLGLSMIDVQHLRKPDMEKLDPEPEVANVESPKPNADNDRLSNYSPKNNTESNEFNVEKIIDKVMDMSSQGTSAMETVNSEDNPRQIEGPQQAPHQWGRPKLWEESQRHLHGGREADHGEIHQRLLPLLPHTLDSL